LQEVLQALPLHDDIILSHLKPQFYDFGQPDMFLAQWR
jgi:hypothetical protein